MYRIMGCREDEVLNVLPNQERLRVLIGNSHSRRRKVHDVPVHILLMACPKSLHAAD